MVEAICALMDELAPSAKIGPRRALITFVADRPGHDLRYAIDAAKIATRARLGAARDLRVRPAQDGRVVSRQPQLVGAHPLAASIAASGWGWLRDPGVRRQRPARPGAGAGERARGRCRWSRCRAQQADIADRDAVARRDRAASALRSW